MLVEFGEYYNLDRPHRSLGLAVPLAPTPGSRWTGDQATGVGGSPLRLRQGWLNSHGVLPPPLSIGTGSTARSRAEPRGSGRGMPPAALRSGEYFVQRRDGLLLKPLQDVRVDI